MDASDIIKRLREKTVFYDIQVRFSTAQSANGANPLLCGGSNKTIYSFSNYDTRLDYFNGRYAYGSESARFSTCNTFCLQ
jgi:hypothetical protein